MPSRRRGQRVHSSGPDPREEMGTQIPARKRSRGRCGRDTKKPKLVTLPPPGPVRRLCAQVPRPGSRSLAYLLLAPAGSRLRPHQEASRSYRFRLPSSQAASAATCAAAHSQGQNEGSAPGAGALRLRARRRHMVRWCSSSPSALSRAAVSCAAAERSPKRPVLQAHTAGGPRPRCRGHGHMIARLAPSPRSGRPSPPLPPASAPAAAAAAALQPPGASPGHKFLLVLCVCCADGAIIN